jgi:hypothetical protein
MYTISKKDLMSSYVDRKGLDLFFRQSQLIEGLSDNWKEKYKPYLEVQSFPDKPKSEKDIQLEKCPKRKKASTESQKTEKSPKWRSRSYSR